MSGDNQLSGNTNLKKQDLSQLDVSTLTPLSPEVISRQATINIGTIGHVAHGKSTVVKAISGVHTVRFKNELERNITIKLDRLSDDQLKELIKSKEKLIEFQKEVDKKYPPKYIINDESSSTSTKTLKSNKRRASNSIDQEIKRKTKQPKLSDIIGLSMKEALDKNHIQTLCSNSSSTMPSSSSSMIDDNASVQSYSSSNRLFNTSEADTDKLSVELNLMRLFSLYTLLHPPKKDGKKSKKVVETPKKKSTKGLYDEEYVVKTVKEIEWVQKEPRYQIKWKGYDEKTWEPVRNIYDCSAYRAYTKEFIEERKQSLERMWNELYASVSAESLQPDISDTDALKIIEKFDYFEFQSYLFLLTMFRSKCVKPHTFEYKTVYNRLMDDMKYVDFYFRRLDQLQSIHKWVEDINKIDKSKNLRVENLVDFELPPIDEFTYTNDVIPRCGIIIPNEPPIGCECESNDGKCNIYSNCCPNALDAEFAYTSDAHIRIPQGRPIFECNKMCLCSKNCRNRVVQRGRQHSLCIFKTPNERGWGVRTSVRLAKGAFVCEYVGEIISHEETEIRGKKYDAEGRTYLFDLDFNSKNNPFTIDAAKYGNVSRFINHSCDPNVGVWAVWTDCLDLNLHKLCLFTLRVIAPNEELTFDYSNSMGDTQSEYGSQSNVKNQNKLNDEGTESTIELDDVQNEKSSEESDDEPLIITVDSDSDKENNSIDESQSNGDNERIPHISRQEDIKTVEINSLRQSTSSENESKEGFTCRCGASKCRKYIFC